jgi:hypothetical protein
MKTQAQDSTHRVTTTLNPSVAEERAIIDELDRTPARRKSERVRHLLILGHTKDGPSKGRK